MNHTKLDRKNVQEIYPLSPVQDGMLLHYLNGDNRLYHEQVSVFVSGDIIPEIFEQSWKAISADNDVLRCVFRWKELSKPVAVILRDKKVTVEYADVSGVTDQESEIERIREQDRDRGFDLETELFRVLLIKTAGTRYIIVLSNHHILLDGWSTAFLLQSFFRTYRQIVQSGLVPIPRKSIYKEVVVPYLQQYEKADTHYWADYLSEQLPAYLPIQHRYTPGTFSAGHAALTLDATLVEQLQLLSRKNKVSPAAVYYCAWGLLLQYYHYSGDVIFDVTLSGRTNDIKGIEQTAGLFINTVPMRVAGAPDSPLMDILKAVHTDIINAQEQQFLKAGALHQTDSSRLLHDFSSLVVFENYPFDGPSGDRPGVLTPERIQFHELTRYDITLVIAAFGATDINITYNEARFDRDSITALLEYYRQLLNFLAVHADEMVSAFVFQPMEETIIADFDNKGPYCIADRYGHVLPPSFTGQRYTYNDRERLPVKGTGHIARLQKHGELLTRGYMKTFLLDEKMVNLDDITVAISAIPGVQSVAVSPDLSRVSAKDLFVFYEGGPAAEKDIHLCLMGTIGASLQYHVIRLEKIPRCGRHINYARLDFTPVDSNANASGTTEQLRAIWSEILNIPAGSIPADSNFFALGANSIDIARLNGIVLQKFGVSLPTGVMVRYNTLEELASYISVADPAEQYCIMPAEKKEFYEVTPQEAGIYLHQQREENNLTYNSLKVFNIEGPLDVDKLERVFQALFNRYEAFRTSFILSEGNIRKVIAPAVTFTFLRKQVDVKQLDSEITACFNTPFNLATAPLCRGAIFETGQQSSVLCIDTHHIICDGYSVDILLQDLIRSYRNEPLPPLKTTYSDYSEEEVRFRKNAGYRKQEAYWMQLFDNGAYRFRNIFRELGNPGNSNRAHSVRHVFDEPLTHRIQQFLQSEKVTLFEFFLCSFSILLSKLTGHTDIVMATPVARRNREELRQVVGLLLNSLLLRNHIDREDTFRSCLATVRDNFNLASAHQDYPFFDLVKQLKLHEQYRQAVNVWINAPDAADAQHLLYELDGATMAPYLREETESDRDLELYLYTRAHHLTLRLQYNTALFSEAVITYILGQYELLINEIITHPGKKTGEVSLFSRTTQQDTSTKNKSTKMLHELTVKSQFEKTVVKYAGRVAVRQTDGKEVTYAELNASANQVADAVSEVCVAGAAVALLLEHDIDMVSGILGVLKTGCFYVPVDMDAPHQRMAFILQDAGASLVLTNRRNLTRVQTMLQQHNMKVRILCLEDTGDRKKENPAVALAASGVAYVLYTSGSTGTPKGIVQTHRGLLHHIRVYADTLRINEHDRLSLFSYYTHDASLMDIFSSLLNGAALYPIDVKNINNNEYIINYLQAERVTIYHSVPTLYRFLTALATEKDKFESLRYVVLGGEPVLATDLHTYTGIFPASCQFINLFGQSEASVTFMNICDHTTEPQGHVLPLGYPVNGTRVLLLDENRQEVPIFATGEIVYESAGLFKEYLNRPLLTEQAFADDHRLFFTGDMGKMLPDGSILFAGRKDFQVKINGYRIEPAEVEAVISIMEDVRQCAVTVVEHQQHSLLVAYFVASRQLQPDEIRAFTGEYLPAYMIPQLFVQLKALPLTTTGKIDRRNLPGIPAESFLSAGAEPPGTKLERELAQIWAGILQTEVAAVNIHADFYSLGGDSLKAISVLHQVRRNYGVDIPLSRFFKSSGIRSIAALIQAEDTTGTIDYSVYVDTARNAGQLHEPFPLTKMQMAYVLGRENIYDLGGFSTQSYIEIETPLEYGRLETCLNILIARHPALRTIITKEGQQVILSHIPEYRIAYQDLSRVPEKQQRDILQTARKDMEQHVFDLSCWPLFNLKAYQLSRKNLLLCFSLGIITADAHSVNIFAKELLALYKDPAIDIEPLSFTFRDYVLAQERFKTSTLYNNSKAYWLNKLEDFPSSPQIPLQRDPGIMTRPRFARKEHLLGKREWQQLKALAQQHNITPSILCCTAYATVLAHWSNQQELALNLTLYNRLPFHKDVDQLMGAFTSLLILPVHIDAARTLLENAVAAQQQFYEALEHRYYDGVEFIGDIKNQAGMTTQVVMPVVFTSALYDEAGEDFWEAFGDIRYHITRTPQVYLDHQLWLKNGELVLTWDYVEGLIPATVIDTMFEQYTDLLDRLPDNQQAGHLSLSNADLQLVNDYNNTGVTFDIKGLQELFCAQVEKYAGKIAVTDGDTAITYDELNKRSNQVAHYLLRQGIGAGDYVGISGEKCVAAVVNILGTLKAGAAYVPIEPGNPEERKTYIYNNSKCKCLLDRNSYEQYQLHLQPATALDHRTNPADVAYAIYTSGTTGVPKGVVITHHAAVNTILDINEKFHITAADKVLGISSLGFDLSVYDIFGTLGTGATLVLHAEQMDVDAIRKHLVDHEITVWNSVPAILDMVVKSMEDCPPSFTLEKILLSGDWIPLNLPEAAKALFPAAAIYSLGGATEAAIWSIYFPVDTVDASWKSIPYGYPLANQQVYILDHQLDICPVEVKGEIYIGGRGVAEGYMNAPEITAKLFIVHPDLGRLYKTGDQGVFKREGYIEFLGRKDFQVKIRGYRIELPEIESKLLQAAGVKNALVTAWGKDNRDKYLCAYLVTEDGRDIPDLDIFLRERLPEYMVPAHFIFLARFPVTANGKIDRKALPVPERTTDSYTPPATALEAKLLKVWSAVLAKEGDVPGVTTNFFELGGNSLNAILLISNIRKELGLNIGLRQLFQLQTIRSVAGYLGDQQQEEHRHIGVAPAASFYALSSQQKRLFFLYEFDRLSTAYNMPQIVKITGVVDVAKLQSAFLQLVYRHESLRTAIRMLNDQPVQQVAGEGVLEIETIQATEEEVAAYITRFIQPFELDKGQLIRVGLIRISAGEHILMVDTHHIITDGVSQGILIRDFIALYKGEALPALPLQYKDYAVWQAGEACQQEINSQRAFWLEQFRDVPAVLDLPYDFPRPAMKTMKGHKLSFEFTPAVTEELKQLATSQGASLFMTLLSVYSVCLSKLSGAEDIVIGTPVIGRQHADLNSIVGMFVNSLPLRTFPEGKLLFSEFLSATKTTVLGALENQLFQYEMLIDELKIIRDTGRNPMFDVFFSFIDFENSVITLPDLTLAPYKSDHTISKFDLTLSAWESEGALHLSVEYATDLFREETIHRFISAFKQVVFSVVSRPQPTICEIEILSQEERDHLIYGLNDTWVPYPVTETVTDVLEARVRSIPHRVALVMGNSSMTYKELGDRIDSLAGYLQAKGCRNGDVVGILVSRSIEMVISIYAILKAGAAYVPVDPAYPEERRAYILSDSKAKFLLVPDSNIPVHLPGDQVIYTDRAEIYTAGAPLTVSAATSDGLAYIIYTSGSTGQPKGVMIAHRQLSNILFCLDNLFPVEEADAWLLKTACIFDVSVTELFGWCFRGGRLVILEPGKEKDPVEMLKVIALHQVTHLNFVPSLFNVFVDALQQQDVESMQSVRYIFLAGEAVNTAAIITFRSLSLKAQLENIYGPTEGTVYATRYNLDNWLPGHPVPIGKPLHNVRAYILGRNNELRGIGVKGELCIAGAGISQGYIHHETLTNEKFVPDPFMPGESMYRTGDMVCWLPDGNIAFLGRIDEQVKIRGYRIELEEITAKLSAYPEVIAAVVAVKERKGEPYLVAYYVSSTAIPVQELKTYLLQWLPEYMVPVYYVPLQTIPLTASGKVDRKALPDPEHQVLADYVAPSGIKEQQLVQVWSEVLGLKKEQISVVAGFFESGGDSIKSIQLSSKVYRLGYVLTVQDIFNHNTVRRQAAILKPVEEEIPQVVTAGKALLAPVQQWFFSKQLIEQHHFNQSVMLHFVKGITALEVQEIFTHITAHHDALRMVYRFENRTITQWQEDTTIIDIHEHSFSSKDTDTEKWVNACNNIQAGISLEQGPLLKLGLFHTEEGSYLLIVVHHLVIDGVSWRILLEDIETLYRLQEQQLPFLLPSKTHAYKAWTERLVAYRQETSYTRAAAWWARFNGLTAANIIPDIVSGTNNTGDAAIETIWFSEDITTTLLREVHQAYHTQLPDLLLTALLMSINRMWGHSSLLVDMEGHGREEVVQGIDVTRTIGWFTTIYPVLLKHQDDLSRSIREVKETLRSIPNKGFDYLLYNYPDQETAAASSGAQISFNYLGQFDTDITGKSFVVSTVSNGQIHGAGNQRNYLWDVLGVIAGGKLRVSLTYSTAQFKTATVRSFLTLYHASLLEILTHCRQRALTGRLLTPADLTFGGLSIPQLDELQQRYEIQDIYPLSPMQEGILFHALTNTGSQQYFEQMSYRITAPLDVAIVEESLNDLMARYDILRTIFVSDRYDRNLQIVLRQRNTVFTSMDIRAEAAGKKEEVLDNYRRRDREQPFDLGSDVLMRVLLLRVDAQEYEFIWSFHHILMDGWCLSIIIKEFNHIYSSRLSGKPVALSPAIPYVNYIKWMEAVDQAPARTYWQKYLSGYETLSALPGSRDTVSQATIKADQEMRVVLSTAQTEALKLLANKNQVTLNTVIQVAWGILLSKYNDCNDVLFGAVVSGRPAEIAGIASMVGLFINTIPVRIKLDEKQALPDLLRKVQTDSIAAIPYHYSSLAEVQGLSPLGRNLLDHILVFENYLITTAVHQQHENDEMALVADHYHIFEQTNYGFTLIVVPGQELAFKFKYDADMYDSWWIEQVSRHFCRVLESIVRPDILLAAEVDMLSAAERERLLSGFNRPPVPYPAEQTIIGLFGEQVKRTPDNVAVIFKGSAITYRAFSEQVDRLATVLLQRGIQTDDIVGIVASRSVEMLTGIYAILRAGAAYLPIEPDYPQERKNAILRDSNARLLLVPGRHLQSSVAVIPEIYTDEESVMNAEVQDTFPSVKAGNLIYALYTSGSTGKPKGVLIEHGQVVNTLCCLDKMYPLTEKDTYLMKTSCVFDMSVPELFSWFFNGGKLLILEPGKEKDMVEILAAVAEHKVTHINFVPSLFNVLANTLDETVVRQLQSLKYIFQAGEAVNANAVKTFLGHLPHIQLENLYGTTETGIYTTRYSLNVPDLRQPVPIGKPLDNTGVLILNSRGELQPVGVKGELCITGKSVGRGYINNDFLTSEKFTSHPFAAGEIMYRSGDVARWLPDGNVSFLGRMDHQVKVRGHRIELDEVTGQLLSHEAVKNAVVIVKEKMGEKYLVAYYILQQELGENELREYLTEQLPDFMVPAFLVAMERFPVTTNGKIDRHALPEPQAFTGPGFIAPADEVEAQLVQVWSDLLQQDPARISVNTDFFLLGGNSLRAMSLAARLHKVFNVKIPVGDIFRQPTIVALAENIRRREEEVFLSITTAPPLEYYPLSSAQKRLYFLYEFDKSSLAYNVPQVIRLEGALDEQRLQAVFMQLVQRHESLRTTFHIHEGMPVQLVAGYADVHIEKYDAATVDSNMAIQQFIRPFDLEKGPLVRLGLVKESAAVHLLMIDLHHIIVDGISHQVLIQDLISLYAGNTLPVPRLTYKDYAVWQNGRARDKYRDTHLLYWKNEFAESPRPWEAPADFPRPLTRSFRGEKIAFELDATTTHGLKEIAATANTSLFVTVLSLFNVLVSRLGNQEDIIVGTVTSGRLHHDLKDMVGMFVNTLAIRNYPVGDKRFTDFLGEVKLRVLAAFDHQVLQYEELIDALDVKRDPSRNPLFDVVLSYTEEAELPDLPALKLTPVPFNHDIAKFDLLFVAREKADHISCVFEYATDLFTSETAARFVDYFRQITAAVIAGPAQRIADISMLSPVENDQLLHAFDYTDVAYPADKTVIELFEEQVQRTPGHLAVTYEGTSITYKELNERAAAIGAYLNKLGVGRDEPVGLLMPRSADLIAGVLGILKAGAAYLPLDVDYPAERTGFMITDSRARYVLTDNAERTYQAEGVATVILSEIDQQHNIPVIQKEVVRPSDLCYIIYTSGTTGLPKGTMIEHRNVVRLFFNDQALFNFTASDTWTMFHSQCFDFSVWEIFGALLFGGRLVVVPGKVTKDPALYLELIRKEQVTVLNQTPSAFYNLVNEEKYAAAHNLSLRYVIFGGEALMPGRLKPWKEYYPEVKLINMFGITETTVHVTYKEIGDVEIAGNVSNIGIPIPTMSVYILNDYLKPVPEGSIGELFVGGHGVARGYLNRPLLNAERFISHPDLPGKRLYRSGDLARVLRNGELEYLGRKDNQVQLRGYRIELREIESRMNDLPEIERCVVMVREEGDNKFIAAYYVSDTTVTINSLRSYLLQYLPEYMIPAYFIRIPDVPLTVNGKVNYKALPQPEVIADETDYAAPVGELEEQLAEIWRQVLKVPQAGRKDNYFGIGGDSMKAIILVAEMNKVLHTQLRVHDLFTYQTIEELAQHITTDKDKIAFSVARQRIEDQLQQLKEQTLAGLSPEEREQLEDVFPMSDIQKGMVYHGLKSPGVYHDQMLHLINDPDFSPALLEKALEIMTARHPVLRTSFRFLDTENPFQFVYKQGRAEMHSHDLSAFSSTEQVRLVLQVLQQDKAAAFELDKPGIWRFIVFKLGAADYLLCFVCHHAIIDGWSDAVFNTELNNLYVKLKTGAGNDQLPLRCSYRDYVTEQLAMLQLGDYQSYWNRELEGYTRYCFSDVEQQGVRARLQESIPDETAAALLQCSKENSIGLRSLCFAAFLYTLNIFSYEDDITVGMTTHNRPNLEDGDKILGCFLNTVPFRLIIPEQVTWSEFVNMVNDKLIVQKKYETVPFTKIIESIGGRSKDQKNPVTDIAFNLLDFYVYEGLEYEEGLHRYSPEMKDVLQQLRKDVVVTPNTFFDFLVVKSGKTFSLNLLYHTSFISSRNAADFVACFKMLLDKLAHDFNGMIGLEQLTGNYTTAVDISAIEQPFNF